MANIDPHDTTPRVVLLNDVCGDILLVITAEMHHVVWMDSVGLDESLTRLHIQVVTRNLRTGLNSPSRTA